jgi:hypothetical protein
MSSVAAPFGLRPILSLSGTTRPWAGTIASGYAANLFQNCPVQISNQAGTGNGTLIQAPIGERAIGSFQGVEYTLTADGRRHVGNWWASGLVATDIVAYYTRDPYQTYEIQANGSLAQSNLGNQANWTAPTAGSTITGISAVALDVATLVDGEGGVEVAGLRIVGLSQYIENAWGDAFTIVNVEISMHQNVANQTAYGG